VINLTDLAIKRIIRMAMKITPFVNMCQEDQIALLKGGCTELMILRSVINYDPENNSWRVSENEGKIARG
jgi:nuclear receptor subfamily 1 group I